jgi:hypothetical protein
VGQGVLQGIRLLALLATIAGLAQATVGSLATADPEKASEPLSIAALCVAVLLLVALGRRRAGSGAPPASSLEDARTPDSHGETPGHTKEELHPSGLAGRRLTVLVASTLFLGALAVRCWHLEIRPAGVSFDEGVNGCVILDILEGHGPGPALTSFVCGEEAGTFYLHAPFFEWLGASVFAFRFPAAFAGSLHAPAVYLLARGFASPLAAAVAGALCVFDTTSVYFSRQANSLAFAASVQALVWLLLWQVLRLRGDGGANRPSTRVALAWSAALGLALGAGLHTYPAFRIMPLAVLPVLLLFELGNRGASKVERLGCPALVLGCVLLAITPFMLRADAWELWLQHLEHVTTQGDSPAWVVSTAWERLPHTLMVLLGLRASDDGCLLFPGALVALMVAGAALTLFGGPRPARSGAAENWTARLFLIALLAVGLTAPLIVRLEPFHTRRFLLMLVPAYVFLAAGLDSLFRLSAHPRARGGWVRASLLAGVCLLSAPPILEDLTYRSRYQDPFEPRMRLLRSACRLARSRPVVVSQSTVRMPFALGHQAVSPEFNFLMRGFGTRIARGLNVFPTFPLQPELTFALDGENYWLPFLQRAFPGGQEGMWYDPECEDYSLRVYRVTGSEAWSGRGLLLSSTAPGGRSLELAVNGLAMEGAMLPAGREFAWRGALYVPTAGRWTFEAVASREVSLELGSVVWHMAAGGDKPTRWLSEGWHFFRLTLASGQVEAALPSLRWALESAPLAEIPDWHFRQELPSEQQYVARELAGEPLAAAEYEARFRNQPKIENIQMAALELGDRIYTLMGGSRPLACFEASGSPAHGWKGLRDGQGHALQFPMSVDFRRFNLSMTTDREANQLYIAVGEEQRLLRVQPDGIVTLERLLEGDDQQPTGISFDRASRTLVCAVPSSGEILRFDAELRLLSRLRCPGVTAVRPSADGRVLHAVVPARGGLVQLTPEGAEVGFWRCTAVTGLSRLACDPAGQVFLNLPGARLMGFSKNGEVIAPMLPLPNPPRDYPNEPPAMFSGIQADGVGEFLLSIAGQDAGWLRVRLAPAIRAPAKPLKDFKPIDEAPEEARPRG